ncbi:MAG: methionyl-tRNA formyltransferase, partial [Ignavibacteriales bacterium]|nr:methionyl-tRNA formyltransferase [Ignavibacteriales bacterium]
IIERGKVQLRPQDETKATPAPKICKEDCRIDWKKPAPTIHNLVRGFSPAPAAWTTLNGKTIRITRTSLAVTKEGGRFQEPGTIMGPGVALLVRTGEGFISILELQQESRRRMSAEEFLRGVRIKEGERFE